MYDICWALKDGRSSMRFWCARMAPDLKKQEQGEQVDFRVKRGLGCRSFGGGSCVEDGRYSCSVRQVYSEAYLQGLCAGGGVGEVLDVLDEGGMTGSRKLYAAVMSKCGKMKALSEAQRVHSHVASRGLELDSYVGSGVVEMYVKCGSLVDAEEIHDRMPERNDFSWNALISGYAHAGQCREALRVYQKMREEGGVRPSRYTFHPALKSCISLGDLEGGRGIHAHVLESGGDGMDMFVATSLLDMYAKCGSMVDARHVFDELPHRDVVMWNAMILGYAQEEEGELGLELYAGMQQEGVVPNDRTFVGALKACSSLAAMEHATEVDGKALKVQCLRKGRGIHSQVVKAGFERDVFVGTMLVDMYAKCGSMVDAKCVFDRLPRRDVSSWTAMISGYAHKENHGSAAESYARMQEEGVVPNERTFVGLLKACSSLATMEEKGREVDGKHVKAGWLEKARSIHSQLVKTGFEVNVFVGNTLIDVYAKCGSMVDARHMFDKLPRRDVVSWNVTILGYAEQEESEEAFKLYGQMQEQGVLPNGATFVSILKACGNTADLVAGKEIHARIRSRGGVDNTTDLIMAAALIDMYGRCGSMGDAHQVFDALSSRLDVVIWNSLIAGYARQGESELVFRLLESMMQEGIQANGITFVSVLSVCSHSGLVDKGQEYFDCMTTAHGVTPTIQHYNCMVDMLGRAGRIHDALAMVEGMPLQPNLVTWTTLLGACRKWTAVQVGRHAFERAVSLDAKHAAAYVSMSSIYANAQLWEDRDKIQAMRQSAGAWKKPGQSWWSEAGGMVHTFVAGDTRHPQNKAIHAKITHLHAKMKEQGYEPDLECVLRDLNDADKEDALCGHSEKLAIACALLNTPPGTPIRVVKNLRVCNDCHKAIALISKIERRHIICRDSSRFHVYRDGTCSCGDYW